nr:LysE family transporter [Helicobacter heilmannii]
MKFKPASTRQAFLGGFLTNILNPKAMLYFGSIFSGLNLFYNNAMLFWLTFCLVVETFLYFAAVALLFSNTKMRTLYAKHYKTADHLCTLFFGVFVIYILAHHIKAWL